MSMVGLVWSQRDLQLSFAVPLRDLVADAALLLILGGLSLIALIVSLVLLGSLFPAQPRSSVRPERRAARRLRSASTPSPATLSPAGTDATMRLAVDPTDHAAGWKQAGHLAARDLDAALDHVVAQGLGQPRILSVRHDGIVLRLDACAAHTEATDDEGPAHGCGYVRGFLQRILQVAWNEPIEIREIRCQSGRPHVCEFDMRVQRGA